MIFTNVLFATAIEEWLNTEKKTAPVKPLQELTVNTVNQSPARVLFGKPAPAPHLQYLEHLTRNPTAALI